MEVYEVSNGTIAQTDNPTSQTFTPRLPAGDLTDRQLLERFLSHRDESAFAALVRRYGPMVFGVSLRVLGDVQEAEDAFQATFLVLVRRAGSIGRPELLGNWLYGVANRIARKARAQAARRMRRPGRPVLTAAVDPITEAAQRELCARLDAELRRLPAKFRAPLVLCYLNGLTNEEAARRLGWPTGSISYRLARGREILRDRLCSVAPFIPPAFLATLPALYAAPVLVLLPRLAELAAKAAVLFAEGESVAALVSAQALEAAQLELRRLSLAGWSKPAFILAASLLILASGFLGRSALAERLTMQTVSSPQAASCHGDSADSGPGEVRAKINGRQ